ncbi:hypothetical protein CUN67_28765 (plasmid) [Pantoea cypripedii]|uniref:VOC domain-containing protein n=1 Tax=Pantoea cypripedii TaxID=55209 RepID=A0A6B9GF30_PANCY|nr:hypothetical protein CUN67_28765 [Pantoea cypripedii]
MLDFRLTGKTEGAGLTWAFLAPENNDSFQIELAAGPGAVVRQGGLQLKDSLGLHGWHHICMRVDNVDEASAELKRRGAVDGEITNWK